MEQRRGQVMRLNWTIFEFYILNVFAVKATQHHKVMAQAASDRPGTGNEMKSRSYLKGATLYYITQKRKQTSLQFLGSYRLSCYSNLFFNKKRDSHQDSDIT